MPCMMGCGLSFGRKRRKSVGGKRGKKRGRKSRRRGSRRGSRRRGSRRRRSRRFGIVAGPGFKAQTSYSNAFAPYFGSAEPFVNASNWWYPYAGGVAQSPQMLMKSGGRNYGPGN